MSELRDARAARLLELLCARRGDGVERRSTAALARDAALRQRLALDMLSEMERLGIARGVLLVVSGRVHKVWRAVERRERT